MLKLCVIAPWVQFLSNLAQTFSRIHIPNAFSREGLLRTYVDNAVAAATCFSPLLAITPTRRLNMCFRSRSRLSTVGATLNFRKILRSCPSPVSPSLSLSVSSAIQPTDRVVNCVRFVRCRRYHRSNITATEYLTCTYALAVVI